MTTQNDTLNRVEYRITIDGASPLAELHSKAMQSFIQTPASGGQHESLKHPILHCAQIDSSHPSMLRALVAPTAQDIGVVVWIPYAHILSILEAPLAGEKENMELTHGVAQNSGHAISGRYH